MNAIRPGFDLSCSQTVPFETGGGESEADACVKRWATLGEAGKVVAMLAGIDDDAAGTFDSDMFWRATPCRRELADKAGADLAAIMEPGIAALLAIHTGGRDCRPAALALWHEFDSARSALLTMP